MSKVKKGIAVFVALTILFLLTLDSRFAVDAFYLTLVPLVLFLILLLRKPDDIWKEMRKKGKKLGSSLGTGQRKER